ncbi:LTA synthase family protein [Candidatus Ruminimicrobium bovinum]|uniref:LTA synthase family protein n=1 Tax=Candidatus Ruminimicrobium bovinum TaxID=3242779 RepID=UPI0039B85775
MKEKFNFDVILNSFLILIPINTAVLFMLTVYRFFFFLYFANFKDLSGMFFYIIKAFWLGFRFDLSIVAYINTVVTLLLVICLFIQKFSFFKAVIKFIKYYYTIIFSLLFLAIFVDIGFFSYFKDHYNMMIFGLIEDDTVALIKTVLADYRVYFLFILFFAVVYAIYFAANRTYKQLYFHNKIINCFCWKTYSKIFVILFIIVLNFGLARGSLSMFPLGLFYSQISPNYFINKLSVNPVHPLADAVYYKIQSSKNNNNLMEFFDLKNEETVFQNLKNFNQYKNATNFETAFNHITTKNINLEQKPLNVILIVMEGFGELPVFKNSKNFNVLGELKTHFDRDILFENFLAAGFITIHALETISLNIPQRPLVNQITQTQNALKCFSSSSVLPYKKAGYKTSFIYGGSLTWRDLENFYKVCGFDQTIGEGNVAVSEEDRHSWGINDDKFFELIKEQLFKNNDGKPQFIMGMSTQTHPPYKIPSKYTPIPLEIPQQIKEMMSSKDLADKAIFEVYQFANRELAKFISDIKNSEFADNTVIAVTGDHNLRELANYSSRDMFLRYAVPFYLYIPKNLRKQVDTSKVGSHLDIMPTLYNLTLSSAQYTAFGNDLFSTDDNIITNIEGLVVNDKYAIKYNFTDKSIRAFNFDKETKKLIPVDVTEEHKKLEKYYKTIMAATDIFVRSQK